MFYKAQTRIALQALIVAIPLSFIAACGGASNSAGNGNPSAPGNSSGTGIPEKAGNAETVSDASPPSSPSLPATPGTPSTPNAPTEPNPPNAPSVPSAPVGAQSLALKAIELAQTHMVPPQGLNWSLGNASYKLSLTANRETLVLVEPEQSDMNAGKVEVLKGSLVLGTVALNPPTSLPASEDSLVSYNPRAWHARLPANLLVPGARLRVSSANYASSLEKPLSVSADTSFTLRTLPFYLFGANPGNSVSLAQSAEPDAVTKNILAATWPMSKLSVANHAAQSVQWPLIVIPPRGGRAAYVARNKDDQQDGFDTMAAILGILDGMRSANGEANLSLHYYAPLMMLDRGGVFRHPGGGLGGGSVGTGDHSYSGIFIHEQGHAFGLPHVGDGYNDGTYPYPGGSLKGSQWAWDAASNMLRSPVVPSTAANRSQCSGAGSTRQVDAQGRCIKQDPMQGGSGDQPSGVRFAMFSDFSIARMQNYMETRLHADASFTSGYKTWDSTASTWKDASRATKDGGLFEFDAGLPIQTSVPVHSIVVSYSKAGTTGASQIYAPISYTGNLMRTIDPTVTSERNSIVRDTGQHYWYCKGSGCDYTLRVIYGDGTTHHAVINNGFRKWFVDGFQDNMNDPLSDESFRLWVVNVPGSKAISKIEVLDTPKVWLGMPVTDNIVLQRSF